MYYEDDVAGDLEQDRDWTEHDRIRDEHWEMLSEALHWVTYRELEVLTKRKDFPGIIADYGELSAFADRVSKGRSRLIPCRIQQAAFTVSAVVDLVSGETFLRDNGRLVPTDFTGYLDHLVEVGGKTRTLSTLTVQGKTELLSGREVQDIVTALEAAGQLPPL